jgi:magnesium chelatase family protein
MRGFPKPCSHSTAPWNQPRKKLFIAAQKKLQVSARARYHIIRVARTIADLDGSNVISSQHVLEAVQYRGVR